MGLILGPLLLLFIVVMVLIARRLPKWTGRAWTKPAAYAAILLFLFGEWAVAQAGLYYFCNIANHGVTFDRSKPVLSYTVSENNGCDRLCVMALTTYPIDKVKLGLSLKRSLQILSKDGSIILPYTLPPGGKWEFLVLLSLQKSGSPLCVDFKKILTKLKAPSPDLPDKTTCIGSEILDTKKNPETYVPTRRNFSFFFIPMVENKNLMIDRKGNILTVGISYQTLWPSSTISRLIAQYGLTERRSGDRCNKHSVYRRFPELARHPS